MISPQLVLSLLFLAIADSLNPALFAAQVYILTAPNPTWRAIAFSLGVYSAAMLGSMILVFGLWQWILGWVNSLGFWYGLIQCLLGLLLLLLGILPHRYFQSSPKPLKVSGLATTFVAGLMATASDVTAFPFWVATEQMAQAKLTVWQSVLILILYNFIYVSPLLLMVVLARCYGQKLTQKLSRFNSRISQAFPWVLRGLAVIIGMFLVYNGIRSSLTISTL